MKILLIRFSSIGDIVLTTPVIRCLKKQTRSEVHFLTKSSYASILIPNPYIDQIWVIQKKVSEILPQLKAEKYDYIIDLHRNLRSAQIKWALSAKSVAFNKINREKWLMVNLKINRLPNVHIVDRYMQTVELLGVKNDEEGLDYFIPETEEVDLKNDLGVHSSYIAFAIGAAHATKRLPTKKIISICKSIKQPLVLLGGPAEKIVGNEIAEAAGNHVINTCGKFNLHQSASVVRQAAKVITHDTGMMHIAAAFQKEIISIWGNTIPEFGMTPYYDNERNRNTSMEVEGLSCRPCSKIGFGHCPKRHFKCMEHQEVEKIIECINE